MRFCLHLKKMSRICAKDFLELKWVNIYDRYLQFIVSDIFEFYNNQCPDYFNEVIWPVYNSLSTDGPLSVMLLFFHIALSHTAPLSCCTFSCSNFFILPFFRFELFSCVALFHVAILHVAMFLFSILLPLRSSHVAIVCVVLCSCCTISRDVTRTPINI